MMRSKENREPTSFKRRRIQRKTEAEDGALKITDLNDDCLEYIFNYLGVIDVINIGLSNTRFQYPAGIVFKQKVGDTCVTIWLNSELAGSIGGKKDKRLNEEQCQGLIPVFGDFISTIEFVHRTSSDSKYEKHCEDLLDVFLKNSLKSLVKIKFFCSPSDWLKRGSKPLPNVESVVLFSCDLSDEIVLLSEIFPKLNHLSLLPKYCTKLNQIKTHFPHLKKLSTSGGSASFYLVELEPFFNLNPQITSYECDGDLKLVQLIAEKLQIERLKLNLLPSKTFNHIHFKNLKQFVYIGDGINNFPFTFDQLEELELFVGIGSINIDRIVKQNAKLAKLTMIVSEKNILSILLDELAKINEITFDVEEYCPDVDRSRFTVFSWCSRVDHRAFLRNESLTRIKCSIRRTSRASFLNYVEGNVDGSK